MKHRMKRFLTTALLCATIPASATAQTAVAGNGADASITALRSNWLQAVGNITKAAEELSEADYGYRPVATVRTFGETSTRVGALTLNAVHDGEHYGNIVTYMRMKGMVPPSSRR